MTAPDVSPAARRRPVPAFYRVTVAEASALTPWMRRITLAGDDLAGYACDGPGSHLELLLPAPGSGGVTLPLRGPDGLGWPDGPGPVIRTYTPRRVDTGARRLVIDFALHRTRGPATAWAESAAPGDCAVVTDGRGGYRIDPAVGFTLLAADESALPAVATILEDAPAGSLVLLFAEVTGLRERISLDTAAELSVTWVYRGETETGAGQRVAEAVRTAGFPGGTGAFWVGLEASAMRGIRRHLLGDRGVPREALLTRGYWKYGVADHPDHDTGEED